MKRILIVSVVGTLLLAGCTVETASGDFVKPIEPTVEIIETVETVEPTTTTEPTTEVVETIPTEEVTEPTEPETTEPRYNIVINEEEVIYLAKMAWGEARGSGDMKVAATMWCVLNRVDARGKSIIEIITAPNQFVGYRDWCPVEDRFYNLAVDVLTRWQMEKQGASPEEVGRVLPQNYQWFSSVNGENCYRYAFVSEDYWDWSLPNPYNS